MDPFHFTSVYFSYIHLFSTIATPNVTHRFIYVRTLLFHSNRSHCHWLIHLDSVLCCYPTVILLFWKHVISVHRWNFDERGFTLGKGWYEGFTTIWLSMLNLVHSFTTWYEEYENLLESRLILTILPSVCYFSNVSHLKMSLHIISHPPRKMAWKRAQLANVYHYRHVNIIILK